MDAASAGDVEQARIATEPTLRPAAILENVPGLIVTQHSGEGKANQYFLRAFNLDHGTDLALEVDDMPFNMPSHAPRPCPRRITSLTLACRACCARTCNISSDFACRLAGPRLAGARQVAPRTFFPEHLRAGPQRSGPFVRGILGGRDGLTATMLYHPI